MPEGSTPELEDLYDERTLRALDAGGAEPASLPWSPRSARPRIGALVTGTVLGLGDVLDPRRERDAVVEFRPDEGDPDDRWVTFVHVPGAPRASRILVRPWLAPVH
jgi:hypothetical protein